MNPASSPKTKEEIDAAFDAAFAEVVPAEQRKGRVIEQLERYREQLVRKRNEGYSLQQIADAIAKEPIAIKASAVTLMKFFRGTRKTRRKTKISSQPVIGT